MSTTLPKGLAVKVLEIGSKSSAIVLGVERTNSLHGLYIRGIHMYSD